MKIDWYVSDDEDRWEDFVSASWNATFLHRRKFLQYHGNRFQDRSIVVRDSAGCWLGILPAAPDLKDSDRIVSHPGITYGGIVHCGQLQGSDMLTAFLELKKFLFHEGYNCFVYKPVPFFYHSVISQDDLYVLFRLKAKKIQCGLSSVIDLQKPLGFSSRRKRGIKKALRKGVEVQMNSSRYECFWRVLELNLQRRYGADPVHSLNEILDIRERFPNEVELVVGLMAGEVVSGVILFYNGPVCHAQYIACSAAGRAVCALDLTFSIILESIKNRNVCWFDFGISTTNSGFDLNGGLNKFKSEFGGRGAIYESYEISLNRL